MLPLVATWWIACLGWTAQEEPVLRFADRYAVAFEEARLRNVPVLVMDFDAWKDVKERVLDDFFRDKAFVEAARNAVLLLASQEDHGEKTQIVDGAERRVCSRFGAVPCRTHQLVLHEMFQDFAEDGGLRSPQFLLLTPDRAPFARLYEEVPVSDLRKELLREQKALGPGMSREGYLEVNELLARSRRSRELKSFRHSVRLVAEAQKLAQGTRMSPEVEDEAAALNTAAADLSTEAMELWGAGRHLEGLLALDRLAYLFEGLPPAKDADRELQQLLASPEGQPLSMTVEAEHKARSMFDTAEDLAEENKTARAIGLLRSLMKKYPESLWAERADQLVRNLSESD